MLPKITLSLAVSALCLCGCTVTRVETPTFKLSRTSILQKLEFGEVSYTTNGATLKGYKTDGGNEAAARIVQAAVTGAIEAAK